jgi:putative ABC transport system permease protein
MLSLFYDLRFAACQLRKTPGVALLAVFTLALGVGANAAIFTVIENVLLRPLPYAHASRLVCLAASDKPGLGETSWLNYRDIRDQTRVLKQAAGYSQDVSVVETGDVTESIVAPRVTPNLFSMLGARPLLGRTFTAAEGETGGPAVAVLSEGLWRQSFHADAKIVGRTVRVGGADHTVVGVMPASFHFPDELGPDVGKGLWLPLQPTTEMLKDRGYQLFNVVAELRPGATLAQAQQELNAIAAHIPRDKDQSALSFHVAPYQQVLTGPAGHVLYALFAALGLVLLIACANVSNVLIARCLARRQEFAVRAALGANRLRLIRQMLAEGFTLSLLGCGGGVLIAELAMTAVHKLPEGTIPRADTIALHWTMVLALAVIAVITTVLSSLFPALLAARSHPQAALQSASRGLGTHAVSGKLSGILAAGEVALSTLLLVGTGLLFHTLWNLEQAQLGFNTARVTTFTVMPADSAGFSAMTVATSTANAPVSVATLTYEPMLERIRREPGVQGAALITSPPLSDIGLQSSFEIVGRAKDPKQSMEADVTAVSGGYARTMGTPVVQGRMIGDGDTAATPLVVVVNQSFVKKYFPGEDPLGKEISLGGEHTGMIRPYSIVGVLGNQVDQSVGNDPLPTILLPEEQIPTTSLFYQAMLKTVVSFVVKTQTNIPVETVMRSLFHRYAPGLALDQFQTMQAAVEKNTFGERLGLYLVSSFAGLAVVMVVAGLYGVLSQLVSFRRREIGVRMALGATRASVAQMVLRQGSVLVGAGLGAGLVLAFTGARLVKSFLYHVQPLDGWSYAAVSVALAIIGLLAALFPARRAAAIEPMQALREE